MKDDRYHDFLEGMCSVHPDVHFGKNVWVGRNVIIEKGCQIGDNTRILHQSIIRANCKIGKNCLVSNLCFIEENVVMGNRVSIQAQTHVTPGVIFEDMVYVGVMCIFIETHRIKHGRDYPLSKDPPYIEYGARIGTGAIIMPGVRIGREVLIATGSLVTKDCEPFWVYMGRPAKKMKPVPADERLPNSELDPYTEMFGGKTLSDGYHL